MKANIRQIVLLVAVVITLALSSVAGMMVGGVGLMGSMTLSAAWVLLGGMGLAMIMTKHSTHTRELSLAKRQLENQNRLQALIVRGAPYRTILEQICQFLEQQIPDVHVIIWSSRTGDTSGELITLNATKALLQSADFRAQVKTLAQRGIDPFYPVFKATCLADIDSETPLSQPLCQTLYRHGYQSAYAVPLDAARPDELGALLLLCPTPGEPSEAQQLTIANASRLTRLALERHQSEAQLHIFERSLEASSNGVLIAEANQADMPILYANPAFTQMTGYSMDEVKGRNCRFLQGPDTHPSQIQQMRQALNEGRDINLTVRNYRKDGRPFWNHVFISPVRSSIGQITHFVGILNDISERKNHENQLAFHATHDALTGLGNRALFEDHLHHDVELAKRHQQQIAVLFIDLDEFKPINDTLGHTVGDRVLINVAKRLEATIRPSDTLCRFGGDEFVLLLPDLVDLKQAEAIAERVINALEQPFCIDEHELHLSASIGIALNDEHLQNPSELIQHADMAMYKAKKQGRNAIQTFTHDINAKLTQRLMLRNDLQDAIKQEQFSLHYQPLIKHDGTIKGFEALLRWQHPAKGFISPGRFIPIAEQTGLIIALGQWVMEQAARDLLALSALLPSDCLISINLSPLQFHRANFLQVLADTLAATGLPASRLELELTEGVLMNDTEGAITRLHALRKMGVRVAIDDFGTGFSSLSYLRHLPVDTLKIDRSFITHLPENRKDTAVVSGIIDLAHHLELTVVAEGIETQEQHQALAALDCDVFQGYLLARPMPFTAVVDWLKSRKPLFADLT
ncbi:putative bifunctional diguanylate cyclase/phosphodiesterase [Vreelandella salicampi]|uniref:cyclic-guanylate-specific phosphodiesterase n=1 Tax=Vreelandella salicampi TaxID=1449798 RepID=A0A7Z0RUU9_9GAMM|nr:EAL domain-containing protein [Halomonas salicampi]NYS60937.1 EAL domain-containing protein [Halomonas salicampi]